MVKVQRYNQLLCHISVALPKYENLCHKTLKHLALEHLNTFFSFCIIYVSSGDQTLRMISYNNSTQAAPPQCVTSVVP